MSDTANGHHETDHKSPQGLEPTASGSVPYSLRDWFAGQAMAGMIARLGVMSYAAPAEMTREQTEVWMACTDNSPDMNHIGTAIVAYEIADAMLKAREAQ